MIKRRGLWMFALAVPSLLGLAACKRSSVFLVPANGVLIPTIKNGVVVVAGSVAPPITVNTTPAALAMASVVPQGPVIAATKLQTWVTSEPKWGGPKLGYLRAGAIISRGEKPVGTSGCKDGWYAVQPLGYVCNGDAASIDLNHPVVKVTRVRRPDLLRAMPYRYAFIRSKAPQYLKVPNKEDQTQYEFKLENHLKWYHRHEADLSLVLPGANDVPEADLGKPWTRRFVAPPKELKEGAGGKKPHVKPEVEDLGGDEPEPATSAPSVLPSASGSTSSLPIVPTRKGSHELSLLELFGAESAHEKTPWWLAGAERSAPHLSTFDAPKYAVIAGRVSRHTGLAFIDGFETGPESFNRAFAVTTDLRLLPISKLKPNVGSQWHGVDLSGEFTLPIAFAYTKDKKNIHVYRSEGASMIADTELVWRQAVSLTGKDKTVSGTRYFETKDGKWLRKNEIIIARKPDEWPTFAKGTQKWLDVSVMKQTLVLWEGDRPVYATLVSTGQDGIGDPKTTKSTVRGTFKIRDKHVTTTMDANEVGNKFELRDVPWVQYFEAGYAMHAAYWHDEYGTPRSHGCINLSPIDARKVFFWTDPPLPPGWHGVNASDETGKGTIIYSHI